MTTVPDPLTPLPTVARAVGDDWDDVGGFLFTYQNPDGSVIDITGYTATALLYANQLPLTGQAVSTIVATPTNGQIFVYVPKTITSTLNPSPKGCAIQILLTDPSGKKSTIGIQPINVVSGRYGIAS